MGISQSAGRVNKMNPRLLKSIFTFPDGVELRRLKKDENPTYIYSNGSLSDYSIFTAEELKEGAIIKEKIFKKEYDGAANKAFGAFFGLIIGDALGAPLEFSSVRYGSTELKGFDEELWQKPGYNRFGLQPGQWTDDASMALCLADSLIAQKKFSPTDLRLRFLNWWQFGYCNAFGFDEARGSKSSVGLGGNISESFGEFIRDKTNFTKAGDKKTSGNGSLMRLSPCAIFYHRDPIAAMAASHRQSKTTHRGKEAAECCRILAHIIIEGINGKDKSTIFNELPKKFHSKLYSIQCLIKSTQEKRHEENKGLDLQDRNWKWKDENYKFSPGRSKEMPGYVGSYSMDALSMAMHCVYSTSDFKSALLKCANARGDADTTAAITGQIAGAIYGVNEIPTEWIETILQWDKINVIPLRGWLLFDLMGRKENMNIKDDEFVVEYKKKIEKLYNEKQNKNNNNNQKNVAGEEKEEKEEKEEAGGDEDEDEDDDNNKRQKIGHSSSENDNDQPQMQS